MALPTAAYNPADGINNTTSFPDLPGSSAAFRLQFQTLYDQARDFVNALKTALEATTDGASGADCIAITAISGVTGATIQAALENLKTQIDNTTLGSVGDGTISNLKLATDVKVGSLAALNAFYATANASVQAALDYIAGKVGTTALGTTATTLTGAIAELAARKITAALMDDNAVETLKIKDANVTLAKLNADIPRVEAVADEISVPAPAAYTDGSLFWWPET